jgi:hypothetical protein
MKKLGRPSPAMAVSLIALVFAMTGSAAAVVSFARNAGAVDGKSAVGAGVKNGTAAGKLVATRRTGALAGTIPLQFLDPATGRSQQYGQSTEVIDNGAVVPTSIASIPGFGTLQATCSDQNSAAGKEDPSTTVTFVNTSGVPVSFARALSAGGSTAVASLVPNQTAEFTVNGSNTFVLNIYKQGASLLVNGVVRQDGAGTAAATCVDYGQATQVE